MGSQQPEDKTLLSPKVGGMDKFDQPVNPADSLAAVETNEKVADSPPVAGAKENENVEDSSKVVQPQQEKNESQDTIAKVADTPPIESTKENENVEDVAASGNGKHTSMQEIEEKVGCPEGISAH